MVRLVFVAALGLLLAVPVLATAHPAAPQPEPIARFLHDCNDDWGGHSQVNDGHDLIALDFQETYNETLSSNAVVFRFVMNGGWNGDSSRPELKDVLTFKSGTQTITKEIRTSDNLAFTGNFDLIGGPEPVPSSSGSPDGTRFQVLGLLKWSTAGAMAGTKISAFSIQAYAGTGKADQMPGGYTSGGQTVSSCNAVVTEQSQPASYTRPDYTLAGPVQYASFQMNRDKVSMHAGENESVGLEIQNLLSRDQAVTIEANAPAGVDVLFHTTDYDMGSADLDLSADGRRSGHFYILPRSQATSGDVTIVLTTELGGRVEQVVKLTILPAGSTAPSSDTPSPTQTDDETGGGLPAWGALASVVLISLLALRIRRRKA